MLLHLARHGNTFNNTDRVVRLGSQTDLALTHAGQRQARRLGAHFRLGAGEKNIKRIYCGPLKRQVETAEIIQQAFSKTHTPALIKGIDALNEIDYGAWEGLTQTEILTQWPEALQAWENYATWPHQVFAEEESSRLQQLSQFLKELHPFVVKKDQDCIIVTSGGVLLLLFQFLNPNTNHPAHLSIPSKVKTGHYCTTIARSGKVNNIKFDIINWNQEP